MNTNGAFDPASRNIDFILDVPLEVTVELGGTRVKIRDLLGFAKDRVLVLSEPDESSVNLYINDKLIARGQIIVENGRYGVQLTEIKSKMERIHSISKASAIKP